MRILLLTPFYAIEGRNDLFEDTRAIHYFTKKWVKNKHEVAVIHTYFNPLKKVKETLFNSKSLFSKSSRVTLSFIDGVEVKLFVNNKYKRGLPELTYFQKRTIKNEVQQILDNKNKRPDIIVTHFPTLYLDLLNDLDFSYECPIVGIFHNLDIKKISESSKKNHYNNLVGNLFSAIGFRSEPIRQKYFKLINNRIKHLFMVYSGVPDEVIDNIVEPSIEDARGMEILYVGKLISQKNVDITLRALKKLDNKYKFNFTIIGEVEEKNELIKLTKKLKFKNEIVFCDVIPRNQVLNQMSNSDIFVMPSTNETLGLVYLEAMANGCITIGTRGEGIDGIIEDKINGFLVEPNNIKELSSRIEKIKSMNNEELLKIKMNAFNKIKKYSESNVASMYIRELEKVILL